MLRRRPLCESTTRTVCPFLDISHLREFPVSSPGTGRACLCWNCPEKIRAVIRDSAVNPFSVGTDFIRQKYKVGLRTERVKYV